MKPLSLIILLIALVIPLLIIPALTANMSDIGNKMTAHIAEKPDMSAAAAATNALYTIFVAMIFIAFVYEIGTPQQVVN